MADVSDDSTGERDGKGKHYRVEQPCPDRDDCLEWRSTDPNPSRNHRHGQMKKLLGFSCWALVFALLLLALDQFFLRIPATVSPHREAQTFYLDFRSRLLALPSGEKRTPSRPPVPGKGPAKVAPVASPPTPAPAAKTSPAPAIEAPEVRYIYVDQKRDLHFADSLQEVPAAYRGEARPLSR